MPAVPAVPCDFFLDEAKALESAETEAVPAVPAVPFDLFLDEMKQKQ